MQTMISWIRLLLTYMQSYSEFLQIVSDLDLLRADKALYSNWFEFISCSKRLIHNNSNHVK